MTDVQRCQRNARALLPFFAVYYLALFNASLAFYSENTARLGGWLTLL